MPSAAKKREERSLREEGLVRALLVFSRQKMTKAQVVEKINAQGHRNIYGRPWTAASIGAFAIRNGVRLHNPFPPGHNSKRLAP